MLHACGGGERENAPVLLFCVLPAPPHVGPVGVALIADRPADGRFFCVSPGPLPSLAASRTVTNQSGEGGEKDATKASLHK